MSSQVQPFQFLLGRLETVDIFVNVNVLKKFQFLLGRLETKIDIKSLEEIPLFQFLLGRLETRSPPETAAYKIVSIPLR